MKKIEKIILAIYLLFFLLLFIDFPGKMPLFVLASYTLCMVYAIGGYKLFSPQNQIEKVFAITGGIVFALSIFTITKTIILLNDLWIQFLVELNGLFFLILLIYILLTRKKQPDFVSFSLGLLVRSFFILSVSTFFVTASVLFKPYRKMIMAFNSQNESIVKNLKIFEHVVPLKEALESGDCDLAVFYAEETKRLGLDWLDIKVDEYGQMSQRDSSLIDRISQAYTDLYDAYRCKASSLYDQKKYTESLNLYFKADHLLYTGTYKRYKEIQKAYSMSSIGLCYQSLSDYQLADSFFLQAINQYKSIKDTNDLNVSSFYVNLAKSYSEQGYYSASNDLYRASNKMLMYDSLNRDNQDNISANYLSIASNYMYVDSINSAIPYLERCLKIVQPDNENYCTANLFYAVCLYKTSKLKESQAMAIKCLDCYKKQKSSTKNLATNYKVLSLINVSLGHYQKAEEYIRKGIDLVKEDGSKTTTYASLLKVLALINKQIGKYEVANQQLHEVLNIYTNSLGDRNSKNSEILSELSDLEITLGEFNEAQTHCDVSLNMASEFIDLNNPSSTLILNNAAYVNYCTNHIKISDSLYNKAIKVNKLFGLDSTAAYAISLNGLGLLQLKLKKYNKADSLFQYSLNLHQYIFGENNPSTATIYLNYATLKTELNKLDEAKNMLEKSFSINKQFYNKEHDVFGDVYLVMGDLAKKEKQKSLAKQYYQKAYTIYFNKFGKNHFKVQLASKKVNLK